MLQKWAKEAVQGFGTPLTNWTYSAISSAKHDADRAFVDNVLNTLRLFLRLYYNLDAVMFHGQADCLKSFKRFFHSQSVGNSFFDWDCSRLDQF